MTKNKRFVRGTQMVNENLTCARSYWFSNYKQKTSYNNGIKNLRDETHMQIKFMAIIRHQIYEQRNMLVSYMVE